MSDINKCYFCGKEINVKDNKNPPDWYGKYDSAKKETDYLVDVICSDCLKIESNRKQWLTC